MPTASFSSCGLDKSRPIIAAISGGADSLALLHLLHSYGYTLIAATFNHGLRPEADEEVEFVQEICKGLGIQFVSQKGNSAGYARLNSLSPEEAARELRYRFLFSQARYANAQAVATGHTADDQAETVLMHFIRGTGLEGLKGMRERVVLPAFDEVVPIVRPLLNWTRNQTVTFCNQLGLKPRMDASNLDMRYFRNRLRHALLPELEKYNPKIRSSLVKIASTLQGDHELISAIINDAWQASLIAEGEGYRSFDMQRMISYPGHLRAYLIRKAVFQLRPNLRDMDFTVSKRAASLKNGELTGGLHLLVENNIIHVTEKTTALPVNDFPQIEKKVMLSQVAGPQEFCDGWELILEEKSGHSLYQDAVANPDPSSLWVDADVVTGEVFFRPAGTGDRIEPLGMARQSVKLSDLFINHKIPARQRKKWPVLCKDGEILWVFGLRTSEKWKITKETKKALLIKIQKKPEK